MKTGRNETCPCGSGRKYKICCAKQSVVRSAVTPDRLASAAASRLTSLAAAHRYSDMEILAAELSQASPQSGFAWKALGAARQMQGKDAMAALEKAAELLPRDPESQSNLGAAFRRVGRLEEAVTCHRRALDILPNSAEVWNNLGNALRDLGRHDEALDSLHRSIKLKPGFAKSHNNLGNALQDLGKFAEAIACYRRALEIDARYTEAHLNLATALRLQAQATEAESCCHRALEIDPDCSTAMILLAEIHSDNGDFSNAEALFRRAITIEPDSPEACAGLAGLRRMTGDVDWLREAQRIVGLPMAPRRELLLRYAMGKYFDDNADYSQAFANYRRANELASLGRPKHDRQQVTQGIDRLMRSYEEEWVCRRLDSNGSERPVFIVGMPRSGTTLAEQILASHAAVFGAGELPFWNTAALRQADGHRENGDQPANLATLGDEYLALLKNLSADASRVVDKMPGNFLYLGLLHAALPKARIIHLRRNPIDTCLSVYFQNFGAVHAYSNDLDDLAHYYAEYARIMSHWRRVLPPRAMLEITYEDLVDDPEKVTRVMLNFLGLPWDAACLDFHRSARPVSTFSKWQARQKVTKTSVLRWRNYESFVAPLRVLENNAGRV